MWTGIDIGHYAIKVVQISRGLNGRFAVVGMSRLRYRPSDGDGGEAAVPPGREPERRGDAAKTSEILRHKLDYIFQNGAIPHNCVLGVSGKDVNLRITHVPFIPTRSRLQKMMQYEVLQIAGKSSENIYADFKPLTIPNKPYPEIPVMVGLAKNTYIDDEIRYLKDIGIGLADICPKVLALSNALRVGGRVGQSETVLLIDIGAENSEVVIQQGKNLLFARNMTGGGNLLTEALKNRLGVSEEQAEVIKHTDGIAATESGAPIKDALRGAIGQIESMLESAISFARNQLKIDDLAVDRILLSGGTARLKGLTEYLSGALGKPVEIFEPFQNVDTSRLSAATLEKMQHSAAPALPSVLSAPDMTVALGLALTGYLPQNNHISFLPDAVKQRRHFYRAKLPLAAAGVAFAVFLGLLISRAWTHNSRERNVLGRVEEQHKNAIQQTEEFNQLQAKKAQMEVQYRRLARVVDKGVFFYEVVNLIKQCPPEAWVKEIKLDDYATKDESSGSGAITPSDGAVSADGAVSELPVEPMKQYVITVKGYLEDDNPQTLDNLKRFVAELNASHGALSTSVQPSARTGGGHEPLLIKASLNKLNKPEAPTPLGKMQFEIAIINK